MVTIYDYKNGQTSVVDGQPENTMLLPTLQGGEA